MRRRQFGDLPDREFQRFIETTRFLQTLNRDASNQLQSVTDRYRTKKEYDALAHGITIIARQILSVLEERKILLDASTKSDTKIRVIIGNACNKCDHGVKDPPPGRLTQIREMDPTILAEIDALIDLVFKTQERLRNRFASAANLPQTLFSAIDRLSRAVLRQRRHLVDIAPEVSYSPIEVVHDDSDRCRTCGEPFD
jgi:hypothetical protein